MPPCVEGYEANIPLRPDAIPKAQQPYPLSAYDRLRMEYHEDPEVAEGKAYWLPTNMTSAWSSASFIVDEDSKGLLGIVVRDYRYPNSQTLDVAWPSPEAGVPLQWFFHYSFRSVYFCV